MHVSVSQKKSGVPIVPWSELADIEMVSFDVFDTLLFRRSGTAEDFFRLLAQKVCQQGLWSSGDIIAFIDLRRAAEAKARSEKFAKSGHREVTLREIYDCWPQLDTATMSVLESDLELADWQINVQARDWIMQLRESGKQLALLSDMYLDKETILSFLYRYLPPDCFDWVLISGESGCSKHDGGLYHMLIAKSGVMPQHILHLGDNPITDGQMARANGLKSITRDFDYLSKITNYERRLTIDSPPYVDVLRKQWSWLQPQTSMAERVGALVYGPFLCGLAHWLLARCKAMGIRHLFCLLREGELLGQVLSTFNDDTVKISTLSISRRSSWLPSLTSIDIGVLFQLSQRRAYTLAECLEDLGLIAPVGWQSQLSTELKSLVSTPLWTELEQLLINNLDKVKEHLAQQCLLLRAYLSEQGVTNHAHIGLLDWGCGASIFSNICRIIPLTEAHFFMAYASHKSREFALQYALEFFLPSGDNRAKSLAASPETNEILLNGKSLSTRGYKASQSHPTPVPTSANTIDEQQLQRLQDFRQGVLGFAGLARQFIKEALLPVSLAHRSAIGAILYRFIQYPLTEEATSLAPMPVPLAEGRQSPLVPSHAVREIADGFTSVGEAHAAITIGCFQPLSPTFWLPGALAMAYPNSNGLFGELAQMAGDEIVAPMLLQQLQQREIQKVVIYGAGELGVKVLHLLRDNGIEVSYFVDRRAASGCFTVDGVTVITLEQAIERKERIFAIASRAFVQEILRDITTAAGTDINQFTVCLLSGVKQYE